MSNVVSAVFHYKEPFIFEGLKKVIIDLDIVYGNDS